MTWTVTLVAETEAGHVMEHPLAQIERESRITPASLGMRVAVEKIVVAALVRDVGNAGDYLDADLEKAIRFGWCTALR